MLGARIAKSMNSLSSLKSAIDMCGEIFSRLIVAINNSSGSEYMFNQTEIAMADHNNENLRLESGGLDNAGREIFEIHTESGWHVVSLHDAGSGINVSEIGKLAIAAPALVAIVKRLQIALGEFCCHNCISYTDLEESHSELLNASEAADELLSFLK